MAVRALVTASVFPDLEPEIRAGLFISFAFADFQDARGTAHAFMKTHYIEGKIISIELNNGVLVSDSRDGKSLIGLLEKAEVTGNEELFELGIALGDLGEDNGVSLATVLCHVIMIASKAVTNPQNCIENAERRMQALVQGHPVDPKWMITRDFAERVSDLIKSVLIARAVLVDLSIASMSQNDGVSEMMSLIAHAGNYLSGAGLTPFMVVCRHVIAAKAPILASPANRGEVEYFRNLLEIYHHMGARGPYLKFLGHPSAGSFVPGNFLSLHAFGLGGAQVLTPTMGAYTSTADVQGHACYQAGRSHALRGVARGHADVMVEFEINQQDLDLYHADVAKQGDNQRGTAPML